MIYDEQLLHLARCMGDRRCPEAERSGCWGSPGVVCALPGQTAAVL